MFGKKKNTITLSPEAQKIVDMAASNGLDPDMITSICIQEYYMPRFSPVLVTEAKFMIDRSSTGKLTQTDITRSMSKALRWASRYTLSDSKFARIIANHYPYNPVIGNQKDALTEEAKKVITDCGNLMENLFDDYHDFDIYVGYTADAISDHWDVMKDKRISYEVLEAMLSLIPKHEDFSPVGALYFIRDIETDILMAHPASEII